MAETHKPFRELLPPGTNFEFIGRTRLWVTISLVFIVASVAMLVVNKQTRGSILNWTIDFKGGTELVFRFRGDKQITSGDVRGALTSAGHDGVEVSEFRWRETDDRGVSVEANGLRVRTPEFGPVPERELLATADAFTKQFADRDVLKASWSGDTMFVRTKAPVGFDEAKAFFAGRSMELKPWGERAAVDYARAEEGTGEHNMQFAIYGIDRQYQQALGAAFPNNQVDIVNVYGVGPKAGAQLRDDGVKAMFYAMMLIMLYLVFRFDVRYAPGAVVALCHDAFLVIGAFAFTWTDFSLTTVAALLTVIGYSVNDTVIIFDRIRENAAKLKDKKFERVINISINETLARSLLTSLTLLVVTLMMNVLSTGLVRDFAFAMNVGVVVGTYSSIFIASPIALAIHRKYYAAPKQAVAAAPA
jgi:preprotein translocase subunit SecF